ncbi:hypothetical protein QUF76_03520 [Desulfobacterales bacterium HSG16]|nr:hypothetical protein [Desulfobacterales bacterium HSG16]
MAQKQIVRDLLHTMNKTQIVNGKKQELDRRKANLMNNPALLGLLMGAVFLIQSSAL